MENSKRERSGRSTCLFQRIEKKYSEVGTEAGRHTFSPGMLQQVEIFFDGELCCFVAAHIIAADLTACIDDAFMAAPGAAVSSIVE